MFSADAIALECAHVRSMVQQVMPFIALCEEEALAIPYSAPQTKFLSHAFFLSLVGAVGSIVIVATYADAVRFLREPQEVHSAALASTGALTRERPVSSRVLTDQEERILSRINRKTLPGEENKSETVANSSSQASSSPLSKREELRAKGEKGFLQRVFENAPVLSGAPAATQRADNKVAMYLTGGSMGRKDFVKETIDRSVALGANALIFEVKGGNVHFEADASIAKEINTVRPIYDIHAAVAYAKERGLFTIARFVAVKDPFLAMRLKETQIRHPKTGVSIGQVWVDAGSPITLEYNRQILSELLKSGIDEVNLDYIRYPTEYPLSMIGLTVTEKSDRIGAFIKMARETIDQVRPETKLGISTYAILGWNYPINLEHLGQDFVRYAPYVDIISPMAYPATFTSAGYYNPQKHPGSRAYYLVYRTMTGYAELLGPEHAGKLRPWIQGYYMSPTEIRDEIKAVYDSGSCGYMVWNAQNNYAPTYQAMKMAADMRPERCLD